MKSSKKILSIILIATSITIMGISVSAHSGKTDANGGHRDNQNKSGLGSYHYHCGGHPAHLHNNGICPYASSTATQKSTKTTTNQGKTTNKTTSTSTNKTQTTSTSPRLFLIKPVAKAPMMISVISSTKKTAA